MKATELREKDRAELETELVELKAELFKLRFQHAVSPQQFEKAADLKRVKRDIARVLTVMRQHELKDGGIKA